MQISGADLFVKALKEENVDTLFAYPGGQAIDLFHALYGVEKMNVVLPRHEQGLVHAADGYARSTGKVGVCLVTSGPGATNMVTGIATANYDSVPLVCFAGQVPTYLMGNNAFQEADIVEITRSICKYAVTVRRREELGSEIKKAFYLARSGKPGVVVVDLPKDIQQELGSDLYPENMEWPDNEANRVLSLAQMEEALDCLRLSRKPIFLLGGGVNIAHANEEMTLLAEKTGIPVVTTIMGRGAIPTNHPLYIGNLGIHGSYAANTAINECDVLFSIGVRFNDRITGKVSEFAKKATIIHLNIDPASISRYIAVDLSIAADAKSAICTLLEKAAFLQIEEWKRQIVAWKQQYPLRIPQKDTSVITPQVIIEEINTLFDAAIITTDVGQNQLWTTQFIELTDQKVLLTSGGFGTMGYGFPSAIGAQLGNSDKDVIAICGDGGIQMNIQEMATAIAYELPIIICVMNNGYLGNVRQWQEMFFHRHYAKTCMRWRKICPSTCSDPSVTCPEYTPDFIRLAESYGAEGIRVRHAEEIRPALLKAKATAKIPTLIEFMIEREENVLPIVPPGNALNDMVMAEEHKHGR